MASQTIFLHLNTGHPTPLNRPFISGSIIYFLSNSYNGVPDSKVSHDNSSVNLINGDDVLLHISIRRKENRIIFNTYRNGAWDQNYQQIGLQSVLSGPGATIKVAATNDAYHISFDENPRNRGNVHTYKKRINANATAVDYWANAGQTRVFSNPLIVQVYDPARRGPQRDHPSESTEHARSSADAATDPAVTTANSADDANDPTEPIDVDN